METGGHRLAVEPLQFGLRVEGIDLTRAAGEVEQDDALRLAGKMRELGREWIGGAGAGGCGRGAEEMSERQQAEAVRGFFQKLAP